MKILSISDLEKLESQIKVEFGKHKLGDVLHSLYSLKKSKPDIRPFMTAGAALFAVRFCHPSKAPQLINNIPNIRDLVDLSNRYYLADPITFDQDLHDEFIHSNPVFTMLRLASSQFPFNQGLFGEFPRAFFLFHEIPRLLKDLSGIPKFDFESEFQFLTEVSILDFITTGFVICCLSHNAFSFSQDYFEKNCKKIKLPDNHTIGKILDQLSADKFTLTNVYDTRKNPDRRFRMYDFNPLLSYPIIKPCQNQQSSTLDQIFFHAPIPELVASRISTGIFYQMYNAFATESGNKFSEYFGHVFEKYVGLVLSNCIKSEQLVSESDLRKFYPANKGKAPDWIVIDGSTAILLECKATRFSRAAQAIASEEAINSSLAQVKKGLKQLASFIAACQKKPPELKPLHNCTVFKPVLVSLETLHLINSILFREHIDNLLKDEGINDLDWQILSIDELEALQPHMSSGCGLAKILDDLRIKTFDDVLQSLISQTKKTFADSFLYPKQEELYQHLGISDEVC